MIKQTINAKEYCVAGYKLIPLRRNQKIPAISNWQDRATDDPDQLKAWLSQYNTQNIGLVTGDQNGIFVLDIDTKHGAKGLETMKALIDKHGHLPKTPAQRTPSGGYHYIFKLPKDVHIQNSASVIGPGLDIRGHNGFIVVSPSRTEEGEYVWLEGRSILELPPADPPKWLVDLIENPPLKNQLKAQSDDNARVDFGGIGKIPEGQRNQTLTSFAGLLRNKGIPKEIMLEMMKIYNDNMCEPPLSEKELTTIWSSVCRYPAGDLQPVSEAQQDFDPMPLPEKKPLASFPTQLFPPRIRKFIEEGAKGLHVQPDFLGGFVLTTAGLAIGNTRLIETKRGWRQKPNLWMCLVAPPGSAKTPALDLAFRPVIDRQKEAELIYQKKLEEYKQDLFEYELEKKQVKDIEELSDEPEPPILEKYYVSDATIEAQMKIMKENPRGIALYLDELAGWIRGMGQYKGGKGNDKQLNMTAWAGKPLARDRLKEGTKSVYNPFLAVLGNLPPAQLIELSGDIKDGFIERFLFIYPDRKKPVFTWDGVDQSLIDMYDSVLGKLFGLEAPIDENNTMEPQVVRLSDEAKEIYAEWENGLYDEMFSDDFDLRLELPWSKMGIQMCRIALIMHYLRWAEGETENEFEVDLTTLLSAMELIEYFKAHYKKVVDQLHTDEEDQRILEVIDWIKKHGENGVVYKRDLQRNRVGGCKKASEVDDLMNTLQDLGYGKIEKRKQEGQRGRPSVVFVLAPGKPSD